jgi:alanyl-tRNA synthetase
MMTDQIPPFMSAADVRCAFLDYFRSQGHTVVPSSSLVPGNDPTLLFTNAGMVQFKDLFLGKEQRDYKRAAIRFAWEFVTQQLRLDPERLWVTVYKDDDEAAELWQKVAGVHPDRIKRLGEKSNFWAMGDTGPCGPCSEIFYDHGASIAGGPPGSPDEDGDRYVEIWNLVFMQFERDADGSMKPLPKPSVDTGAGLERLAAVMQGVHSNYDIDLFRDLIRAAAELTSTRDLQSPSLRVIADHIRACSFLVSDGVVPSNEGRGYVLRRIARRAMRHGYKLGQEKLFFHGLVPVVAKAMGDAYPELLERALQIERVLRAEEEQFSATLAKGMVQFEARMQQAGGDTVPGSLLFLLHDTYGFPPDLTADIARERNLQVDLVGYEREMEAQRERARAASKFGVDLRGGARIETRTDFCGYDSLAGESRVVALLRDGALVDSLAAGENGEVVLESTPFYAESGGQMGDTGTLVNAEARFVVGDTQKRGNAHAHLGRLERGSLRVGDRLQAHVDAGRRAAIRLNHSATHLLHAALRQVLGTHVTQKGSLVAPDRLRFDFAHFQPVSAAELAAIERLVNEQVRANTEAHTRLMDYEQAIAAGAIALFGEKYERQVRVLSIGDFSTELCGGTHVTRAGDIGLFRIVNESGVAAGVRRIEAVTGQGALDYVGRTDALLREVSGLLRGTRDDVVEKLREQLDRARTLEKEVRTLKDKLASGQGTDLAAGAVTVGSVKVLAARVDGTDAGGLRAAVDQLKSRLGSAIIVLATVEAPDKIVLVAGVTGDLTARVRAGELVGSVAAQVGGKGGGRADFAQAGGNKPQQLDAALASVVPAVRTRLSVS